jgi:hypothetical protein
MTKEEFEYLCDHPELAEMHMDDSLELQNKTEMQQHHLSNTGNVDDIRNSMRLSNYSTEYLESEIKYERRTRNRSTVIKLYRSAIKRNEKSL